MAVFQEQVKPTGAVMVVGGGISGMQSALDLAEAGFRVYLVDRAPAIGGTMARLDKTFPTNDCAMCIMSPKLVDCGRHLDIEIITGATVKEVAGEPGALKVRLEQRPRYVELEKCTACGDCTRVCPVDVPNEFDAGLGSRKAIYKLYSQATPNAFAIEKNGVSPCRAACPAGVNAHGYVALARAGKWNEAWELIRRALPFPSVCGRVCNHPCEEECYRAQIDAPVAIRTLKRYITHRAMDGAAREPRQPSGRPVAIVGAGPAGLTCAAQLARRGYAPTVFEALPVPGGMMRVGIPEYRLPKDLVAREVALVEQEGVKITTSRALGRDFSIDDLFVQGFAAVFLALGAHQSQQLGIPGEDLPGVLPAIPFLREVALGSRPVLGGRVAVIGGGNTAMDAARTARRLGAAHVTIVYRRTEGEITALPEEIAEAREEGIEFLMLASPLAFSGTGRLESISCIRNRLGEPDASGRRRPLPVPGSEFTLKVDTAIVAVGQRTDPEVLARLGLELTRWGTIAADRTTMATSRPGVFAGGDVVTGPSMLVDAVGDGNAAALAIDAYLRGDGSASLAVRPARERVVESRANPGLTPRARRVTPRLLDVERRVSSFEEVALSLTEEEAMAEAARCLNCAVCCECQQCVAVCGPKAIDHGDAVRIRELDVGAVILSPGFDLFDARARTEYGYGIYPNVVSSMEFERMLSASGPFQGHVTRPSDGQEPRRVAFIQCVGSRDTECGQEYCSAVCCMYATKEAIIAQEHIPGLAATVFYMDVRAFGKEFEYYYSRAQADHGIRYEKCVVSTVKELQVNKNLVLRFRRADGTMGEEEFDLVVLSLGLRPPASARELAAAAGVQLDEYGFCVSPALSPGATSRPGVFVAGAFREPKDIPETVIDASCAAARAAELLSPARGTLTRKKEYPPEKDVTGRPPRVGVFVCHCGINIGSVIDVPSVVNFASRLPGVVWAEEFLFTCSQDSIERMVQRIEEHALNRVVVASCTPRTHEALFRESIRAAGLNPYLFELANIREQSSWVHRFDSRAATAKARDLVSMAVAKARLLQPIAGQEFTIDHSALVVGGGASGMAAALSLAGQGFQVHLVEKEAALGGNLRHLQRTLEGDDVGAVLDDLIAAMRSHPLISVHLESTVVSTSGYLGNYATRIQGPDGELEVKHGVVLLATGASEGRSPEYGLGRHPAVLTQLEFEERLAAGELPGTVAMIQCAGSREPGRPYCSRICCSEAVKNALYLKELSPGSTVVVFYRDVRTYGFKEKYYRKAREQGVIFVQYDVEEKPTVRYSGAGIEVEALDPVLGERILVRPDYLVLSTGVVPNDNAHLSQVFKVPLTQDGFYSEAHLKLRPVEFAADGIYLCGLAHGPKLLEESLAQARAAAVRAVGLLAKPVVTGKGSVARVNARRCTACGLCVNACPYDARAIDAKTGAAEVRAILCQGCGACVVACPSGASELKGFEKRQIMAMIDAALAEEV
ncbi:MAG: FAD-dependent oxidoreductase [Bacillota bacterium]